MTPQPLFAAFFGGWEIILILVGFVLPLAVVAMICVLIYFLVRHRQTRSPQPPEIPTSATRTDSAKAPQSNCPHCGKPVPPTTLGGICPECMLKAGLATQTEGPGGAGPHGTKVVQPPPLPAEIAALFPQLEILECLGRGGMGVVYKARQPRLNRLVALKILAREKEQDAQFAERFTREAQALARLNHPNIVTVYDFGTVGQTSSLSPSEKAQAKSETGATPVLHYLLMEFVDGLNLRQLLQTGKMPAAQALTIVPKICEALQYAHEQGIVHRDIKPENILLDKSGRVKIADFGIAKMLGDEPGQQTLTGAKDAVGTPHYMAPEQIEKPLTVDHRADIYSLGVVFYEMLTGELPLGKFQPPSQKVQMDVRLDEVVLHALEKEPDRRYQQASEVKTRLETIAATDSANATPAHKTDWWMWSPFHSPEMREICAHLRKEERNQASLVAVICGVAFGAIMIGGIQTWNVSTPGPGIWIVFLVLVMLFVVCFPIGARMLRQLLCATAWATQRGYKPEQFRIFSFRGNNLWKGLGVLLVGVLLVFGQSKLFTHLSGTAGLTQSLKEEAARTKKLSEQPAAHRKPFYIGQTYFPKGDSIEITSVARTPEQMVVKGHYNLVSHDKADLALYITVTNENVSEGSGEARPISKGRGDFTLVYLPPVAGLPHVSMYANGHPFASLYFGTKAEAQEENRAGWITNSPSASAEIWSPTLAPGKKPDLQKIRDEVETLMKQGHYEEALQRQIWYFNHALEYGEVDPVRLSFGITDWAELGRRYPKAKEALVEIRDRDTQKLIEGSGNSDLFSEVDAINNRLNQDDATYTLFKSLDMKNPELAQPCYFYAEDLLVQKGEYQLCRKYMGRPQFRFSLIQDEWESDRDAQKRAASTRESKALQMEANNRFVGQTCRLIEILVGTGQKTAAEKIGDQAVAVLDDPRLKSAVSDAEEKIQKHAASDSKSQTQDAVSAAKEWLTVVDADNYSRSWKGAAPFFQGAVTETSWETSMISFRKPLGSLISRKLKSAQLRTEMPGAPDGQYVVMQFETSFANKKSAIETVTVGPKQDGQWKASGYYIK